jgi:hypothetical protein
MQQAEGRVRLQRGRVRGLPQRFSWLAGLAITALALVIPINAKAQLAGTGAITGTVTDTTGAIIPNATVTATSVATNVKTVRTTTGAGDYTITPLAPGAYTLTVSARGFQTFLQKNVTVNALATVTVNAKLAVGAAEQTVTVSTAPPVLETTDATLGAVMDNEMYSNLPLEMGAGGSPDQRRATDFAYLMPGVSQTYVGNGNSTDASPSVNGGNPKGGVSEIYIDGVNLPEADGIGDPRFTWTAFGVDSIDQFQVQTSGYSTQYGGQGVQNYSIKQGTNQFHGAVYEYVRNTSLDAWAFFDKVPETTGVPPAGSKCAYDSSASKWCAPGGVKPGEHMNEYGIDLGGPILKNKIFLFYNYGGYRYSTGGKPQVQTIPTAAMMGYDSTGASLGYADFSGYSAATKYNVYDPATQIPGCAGTAASPCTRTQFTAAGYGTPADNQIPAGRISQAAAYINKLMLPYEASAIQDSYSNNVVVGYPSGLSNWYTSGRIDYDISASNQLSAIIAFGRQASTGPNAGGAKNALGPPFNTSQSYAPKTTVDIIKDTWTISPHVVNQFAAAFGRYSSLSKTPNEAPQYAASKLGLLNTPEGQASYFPGITFKGEDAPGSSSTTSEAGYSENLKVNNTYTLTDNVEWMHGNHNFTFGGQVVEVQFNYLKNLTYSSPLGYTFDQSQTGQFSNPAGSTSIGSNTGSPFASYMLGAVNSSSVTVGVPGLGSRWLNPSFWGQDDWKLSRKLTLNLGLRWDIFPSIHEVHNLFTWFDPNGQNSITGNKGTLAFAGGSSSDGYHAGVPNPSSTYLGNLAPRIGLAYQFDSKTVIRASYGLSYARGDWTSGSQSGSPSTTGLTPSASAPGGISGAPSFYWDNTACTGGNADGVACGWTGSVGAPAPPAGGSSLAEFGTGNTSGLGKASVGMTYWDPHYGARTPEYLNWTFGVERQLTRNMSIDLSYVGSEGHFLSVSKAIGSRNNMLSESMAALAGYNTNGSACSGATCTSPLLGATSTAANLAEAQSLGFNPPNPYNGATYYSKNSVYQYYEPFPQFSGVSDTTSFVGNENWNALEISLRQRPAQGLNFMLNYTYSKSIDDLGTFRVGDNPRLDRSLSQGDMPQSVTGTVVYALPAGRGHVWGDNWAWRALASNWLVSGITSYHSGSPIAITGKGCGGAGILDTCMPNVVAGQQSRINGGYGSHATAAPGSPNYIGNIQYINPAAFTVNTYVDPVKSGVPIGSSVSTASQQYTNVGQGAELYVPGNAPRVAALNLWGMGSYNVDLALKRTFPIYHEAGLKLEADMLNVTNHVVFSAPNSTVNGGGSFGTIGSQSNLPRDFQLSARIQW